MPSYRFKVDIKAVEQIYMDNTGRNVYDDLGNVDFGKALLFLTAEDEDEALAIRKGITDIRMWIDDSLNE